MAAPTPVTTTQWDGARGIARWYAAWTAVADADLTDSIVVDVSALSPVPEAIGLRSVDIVLNGTLGAKLEYDNVATGVVNTATTNLRVTWVSGDKFDTNWVAWGNSTITINAVAYAIVSVDSATQITLGSDPGNQTGVAYTVDEFIDQFVNQASVTYQFIRDYTDGPNKAISVTKGSASLGGDIILTTSDAADGDEISLLLVFGRS